MQKMLSMKCAEKLMDTENVDDAVRNLFEKHFLSDDKSELRYGGVIALKSIRKNDLHTQENNLSDETNSEGGQSVEYVWAHTTETMGVGFFSSACQKPKWQEHVYSFLHKRFQYEESH